MPSPHWNWKGNPKEVTNSLLTMGPESKNCFVSIGIRWITFQWNFERGSPAPVSKVAVGHADVLPCHGVMATNNRCWSRKSSGNCSRKTPTMSDTTAAMAERSKTERHGADQWEVGSAKRMIKENIMKDKWWNSLEFVGMMFFSLGGCLFYLAIPWATELFVWRHFGVWSAAEWPTCLVLDVLLQGFIANSMHQLWKFAGFDWY